jgi:hypothetical protein
MTSDTGLAWKLPVYPGNEFQFRCGSEWSYGGAPRQDHSVLPFQGHMLRLSGVWHWSLYGPVGLECEGIASPALGPGERDRISQGLRATIPVGANGQFQLGAKHFWDGSNDAKPGIGGAEFFGGVRLKW